jgi:peptidylprolyl isomerase
MSIQKGSVVTLHYTGTLEDGTEFDSSRGRDPLEFTVGGDMLIPGFENGVIGHEAGDQFTLTVKPEDGYGAYSEELVFAVPLDQVPEHITPETGMVLELTGEEGDMDVTIIDVTDTTVLLDANHALAGETLTFALEILHVKD